MEIFRRNLIHRTISQWFNKFAETAIKASVLLIYPIPAAAVFASFWYFVLYEQGIHFHDGMMEIAVTAWISTFGILYGLFAAVVLGTVWDEYKSIRMAIKNYDIATFMNLRDEEVSPVVYVMMTMFSLAVIFAFMGLDYPDAISGLLCVLSTTYLLGLVFFVVKEIDNPLTGVWFIKNVHREWLEIDAKTWRQDRHRALREAHEREREALAREV